MKILQISAGRERSVALASDGSAHGWGGIKLLGATLPPGYPGELCTSSPTEIGHNRYAQPIPQMLNPGVPFSTVADGYVDTLGVKRSGDVLSCRPVVSKDHGAAHSTVAGLPLRSMTSPDRSRRSKASRTAGRPTPNSSMSSRSEGRFCPTA